jgi:retinol dehydrogenase 12
MTKPLDIDLNGRIAVVTGATGGIGKEIARGLARLGAEVVIGSRDAARGEATAKELAAEAGKAKVSSLLVDMAHLESVRRFAGDLLARHPKIHVLVNNAGVWSSDRHESPDGHEVTFATNALGPYLLTELLVDALKAGKPARVVNVVSSISANYDLSDLEFRSRKWDGFKAYGQSKQALRMITGGLARRLEGSGVTVNDAAPGFVKTGFNRNAHGFLAAMINLSAKLMADSPEKGADTPLWVAAAPELEGVTGKYFEKRKEKDAKFRDPATIAELEQALAKMTGSATVGSSARS